MPTFEYAPAPESRAVVDIASSYGLFIDGEFVEGQGGEPFKTINPATEEVLAEVAEATEADVDARCGRRAPPTPACGPGCPAPSGASTCSASPASCRSAPASSPCSRPSTTASRSASRATSTCRLAAAHFFYHAGWADKLEYAGLRSGPPPLGVAGQIIPWNFPLLMLAWKIAPALACGNTVVLKPAETTPLTALLFAEICQQADLPPGVVNIVTGAGDRRGARRHPTSTRSPSPAPPRSARRSQRRSPAPASSLTLELGGKAANIVFDDAPIDQAVEGIVNGIFFNQGHVCCAGSRLLVQESIADDLVLDRLKRRLATLRLGDPLDKNTDIGAINSAEQLARISELATSARPRAPSAGPAVRPAENGFWFPRPCSPA
jgi:aldehyde dehydrogenase (NAD+)